jgi:hypothetical protein
MAILQGSVAKVRNTVSVNSSGEENSQTSTTHISVFQINGQPVQTSTNNPIMIDEGDEVRLAGYLSKGVFYALTYQNQTNGVSDSAGSMLQIIVGFIFIISGLVMPIAGFNIVIGAGIFTLCFGALFVWVGWRVLKGQLDIQDAVKELELA